jgi:tRNA dimethylallyltransferase
MINLQNEKKPLIIIAGPTACGKTAVSVELAKLTDGEIVSADSMQVYKYMDIGTAKITPEEMCGVRHYLVDELNPDEDFSVAVFKAKAKEYINEIHSRNKLPVMVGGTGFYINAVIYDNDFSEEESDGSIRAELREYLNKNGREALYAILKETDPEACETIHINNTKRVIRAIEYFRLTGEKISEHNKAEKQKQPIYDCKFFVLNMDRDKLYERIDKRIDIMLEKGLVKEVESLYSKYDRGLVSMQGLGYKEIIAYLEGECSFDEAVYTLKRDTRHFAKRQLTWFRHQCDGIWVDVDKFNGSKETAEYILEKIRE